MDKKYSVDDILEEIKRKKMGGRPPEPVAPPEEEEEIRVYKPASSPLRETPVEERRSPPPQPVVERRPYTEEPPPPRPIGASLAELMEKEFVTTENKEYFQGTGLEEEPSPVPKKGVSAGKSFAAAFGDEAFKPHESKATQAIQEKHKKKFGVFSRTAEQPEPEQVSPMVESHTREVPPISVSKGPPKREVVETVTVREEEGKTPSFRVNLKENFFDENDKEHTQMDIPVKNMDSSKAAKGFTRTIPTLEGGDDEQRKRRLFAFGDGEDKDSADDYSSPSDTATVDKDLRSMKVGILVRIFLTIILFGSLIYFGLSYSYPLPLPSFMFPERNLQMFLAVNLGLTILAALVSSATVGGGLISLFTLKADSDTPAALAILASITQGVALTVIPERLSSPGVHMYFAVAVLILLFNAFGKLFMINRIIRNFKVVSSDYDKYSMLLIKDKTLAHELTWGQNIDEPAVAYSCKTGFPSNFLQFSYTEDYSENINKIITPLFLVFSLIISIVSAILNKDTFVALTVFTAMTCICAPLTSTIIGNLPLNIISKKLTKQGAVISGYQALEDMDQVTTITVDANELFAGGTVILHGIKAFVENRIDEAIVDAASVSCKASGLLMDIFMEMIGHKENLLKNVDSLVYEDGMGISAWVNGKRVLIGNRQLIMHHGIQPPSKEYETKFRKDGREIVYLSNSGELTAMFVISYCGSQDMKDYLDMLAEKGVSISVYTTDPNITVDKIHRTFDFPEDLITVMSSKVHSDFNQAACDREKAPAKVIYCGSLASKVMAICSIISGKSAVVLGTILQLIGMVLGYGIIAFFAFTGKMETVTYLLLMVYQLVWAIVTSLIPNLRKY